MADNTQDRGSRDRARINIHEEHELRYWTQSLGVSRQRLQAVVDRVGTMTRDVRAALKS